MTDRAVIFDLDGTIVDSGSNYFEAEREVLHRHGARGFDRATHGQYTGIGMRDMLDSLRGRYGLREDTDTLLEEVNASYLALATAEPSPVPGMRELIQGLHADGHRLGVASGSSRDTIETVLAAVGLGEFFRVVVSAEEVPAGKPDPAVFLRTARQLGVAAARTVVIEDSVAGVRAARAARMGCVAVPAAGDYTDPGEWGGSTVFPQHEAGTGIDPGAVRAAVDGLLHASG
ncbi:HAD family hydrolase [Streptomyces daliensis]|uniref:HAD family phosphatase n=1 Tax=Streptomyces daliensis TaxID=299421 RepID=A0A8T4IIE9_9ACTN|nr:HAD family phosphatase [Streptomyces daliensis]